jgi:hypothetical protein
MQDHDSFTNRTDWFTATAALTIWFAHFMLGWCASVIWPGQATGRIAGVLLTLVAFASLGVLWRRVRPVRVQSVAGLGLGLAATAIAFSTVPALIG